jgi:hypothetical protein
MKKVKRMQMQQVLCRGDSLKTPVENEATEWPTAEEIRTTIAAEQTEVYWLANAIQIPEQMNCYTVDALDMEMFWDTLKEKLAKWQRCDRERHIVDF